jgi:hypothetical protein
MTPVTDAEVRAAAVVIAGFILLVVAAWFVHPAAALALLGVGLMFLGWGRI